jgi:thaumarchaeosortase
MTSFLQAIKNRQILFNLLPLIAFAVPLIWLYTLDAASFEAMWKGRTFQLFFIWLVALELIMGWDAFNKQKLANLGFARTLAFVASLFLPTIYVLLSYYGGLNAAIMNWATLQGVTWANTMPLSIEYLAFAVVFLAIVLLEFGVKGIKAYSVPAFFLVLVGAIYLIDNVFPYGTFTPFQIFVPTTTSLASYFLNSMGYTTSIQNFHNDVQGTMPFLTATNPSTGATATFSIAWPCAGIESFLIFTVVMLLFLKRMPISLKAKVGYFAFGAAVTYFLNSLRIVNIFTAGMVYGENSVQVQNIHFYYGPLYAVAWIVMYPLLILATRSLWRKLKKPKAAAIEGQPASLDPA